MNEPKKFTNEEVDTFLRLQKNLAESSDLYLRADERLFREGSGFRDGDLNKKAQHAKLVWQEASKEYYEFMTFMRTKYPG